MFNYRATFLNHEVEKGKPTRRLLQQRRLGRARYALLADTLVCPISVWLAFYLRLGEFTGFLPGFQVATLTCLAIALPVFYFSDLYRMILRHATWTMLVDIVRAMLIYGDRKSTRLNSSH